MKLNSPWKSLFWEELNVSGVITFLLLFIGLCLSFLQKYLDPRITFYMSEIDIFTYALPGLNGLLILLLRGNFGELRTGFQKRLFYLPVGVSLPVTIILFLRLGFLLTHVVILRSVCLYLFLPRNTPYGYNGLQDIFDEFLLINMATDGGLFLFLQLFVWLFHYSKSIFFIIVVFISAIVVRIDSEFFYPFALGYFSYVQIRSFIIDHPVIFLILSIAIVYPISLLLIKFYRHNMRLDFSVLIPNLSSMNPFKSKYLKWRPFRSEFSAVFWYELHYHRLFILKWTCLLWLAVNLFFWFDMNDRYGYWRYPDMNQLFHRFMSTALVVSPFIALFLACIYCYLRYTLRMGKEHEKYSGLTRHVPINEYYLTYAYLSVLFINVVSAVIFVFILNMLYLAVGKSFPSDEAYPFLRNLGITFQNIINQPVYTSFAGIVETFSIFFLCYLALSLVIWAILACKEILPALGVWLLAYGWFDSILFNLEKLSVKKHFAWHDVVVNLFDKVQYLVYFFHPMQANYFLLVILLCLFLAWRAYRTNLLNKPGWLNLFLLFILIFASIYPWSYRADSFYEQAWLLKLYIGLAIFILVPWLSVLLCFFGFRWRYFWRLSNFRRIVVEHGYSHFFWKSNRWVLIALLILFINRVDIWQYIYYPTENAHTVVYGAVCNARRTISNEENIALKIMELFPLYDDMVKEYQSANPNTCSLVLMVGGCAGYNQCWTDFMKEDTPLPILVYNASKSYHEKYGSKITLKLHEILKGDISKSQYTIDLIDNPEDKEYEPYWKLNFFAGELLLEAVLQSVDGDIGGMLSTLEDTVTLARTIDEHSKISYHRYGIMAKTAWFCEWFLNHFEVPEEVVWEMKRILETIPPENYNRRILDLKEERSRLLKIANSPKEYWSEFLNRNKPEGYRLQMYYFPESYFFTPFERWLVNLFRQKELCNTLIKQYVTLVDLLGFRYYERRETDQCYASYIKLWRFINENGYVDYKQFKDLSKFILYSNISYPLEYRRVNPSYITQYLRRDIYIRATQTLLALELYRLEHGNIPPDLDILYPGYINEASCDPWNYGLSLTLRRLGDTGFTVYSYGNNAQDDGGVPILNPRSYPLEPRYEDVVATLYPLEMRNRFVLSHEFPKTKEFKE